MSCENLIADYSLRLGLCIKAANVFRLAQFIGLLLDYADKASLTSLRTCEQIVESLMVDSLAISLIDGFGGAKECLDIGPGGGFPSVPLSIISPKKSWVGVERKRRKAAFLRLIKRYLSLENYRVVCDDLCRLAASDQMVRRFDLVVSRAVRLDAHLTLSIKPVLKEEAQVVLYRHSPGLSQIEVYGRFGTQAPSAKRVALGPDERVIGIEYLQLDSLLRGP